MPRTAAPHALTVHTPRDKEKTDGLFRLQNRIIGLRPGTACNRASMRTFDEIRAAAELRAYIYGAAQALTGNFPSLSLLAGLMASPALALLAEDLEPLDRILAGARRCLDDEQALRAAEDEYRRLYVGPHALPAPLWESVYRDPEHLLFGEATLRVRRFYARRRLAFANRASEPDDHISIELEFMRHLAEAALNALDGSPAGRDTWLALCREQREFLDAHLLQWAPQSFALQLPHAATDLYAGTAELIIEFLPYDASLLTETEESLPHERV